MPEKRNVFQRAIRKPFKILRNYLTWQIILSMVAAIFALLLPLERFERYETLHGIPYDEQNAAPTLFTKEQLSQFTGENGGPIYLAILGSVYDVSKGLKHYGPGCSYNFFVGRDASVGFITGEFSEFDAMKADDVIGQLQPRDLLGLDNWKRFYDKDYIYKGKLIGRFYDQYGMPTPYMQKFIKIVKHAEEAKQKNDDQRLLYPDCNIEWSEEKGTRVWCTDGSGGIKRSWIGHPRKLYEVGVNDFRCACIKADELKTTAVMLKEYENCDPHAFECFYKVD